MTKHQEVQHWKNVARRQGWSRERLQRKLAKVREKHQQPQAAAAQAQTPAPAAPVPPSPPPVESAPVPGDPVALPTVADPVSAPELADPTVIASYRARFDEFGIGGLWDQFRALLSAGYGKSDPALVLQQLSGTPEYKARFKGNEARKRAGLAELNPAQYVALENQYRDFMATAGLPKGFYDSKDDFTRWIENDVSPMEAQSRVASAKRAAASVDPGYLSAMSRMYGVGQGEIAAYFLDSDKATALLERQADAAVVAGAGENVGVSVDVQTAEVIGSQGVGLQQAQQQFGMVADERQAAGRLGDLYGSAISTDDLVRESFHLGGGADVSARKRGLASQERAAFSGTSGIGQQSLSKKKQGL